MKPSFYAVVNCRYEFHGKRGDLSIWAKYNQLTSKKWGFVTYKLIPKDLNKAEILEHFNEVDVKSVDFDTSKVEWDKQYQETI